MTHRFEGRFENADASKTRWPSSRDQVLTDKDLAAVLRTAEQPRELALLSLLSATGLRMIEVPRLEVEGLIRRLDGSALLYVPPGAWHLGRLAQVPVHVMAHLDTYLAARAQGAADNEPLFLGDEGRGLTAIETGLIVLRAVARVGIDAQTFVRVDGTQLRIADVLFLTFVSRFLRAGGEIEGLRRRLGQSDIRETRYLAARLMPVGHGQLSPVA